MMVYTALLLGLAGSLHCAGMCSPLVAVVSAHRPLANTKLIYNTARIMAYALMGAVAAAFGSLFSLHPYQNYFSVAFGLLLLAAGLGGFRYFSLSMVQKPFLWFTQLLKKSFASQLKSRGLLPVALLGFINGFLPCGLAYLALGYCLILPSVVQGAWFMLIFGLGTWPVMIGFSAIINLVINKIQFRVHRIASIGLVCAGILLIGRVWIAHVHESSRTSAVPIVECK